MIQLEQITITAIAMKDAWKICDFMVANEDRFKRYFPGTLAQNLTPTLSELFTKEKVSAFKNKEEFLFTVKENLSKKLVGLVYIKALDWNKKQGEFAYCIDYTVEGKSYTSTTVTALTKHAFENLGLETLQIITHKDNLSSVKVAEKCAFKWTKTLVKEFTPTGEIPLDMELYELYNER